MGTDILLKDQEGGVLALTLNRPALFNALNVALLEELTKTLEEAEDSESVKCVVISGSGKNFCAGADITEVNQVNSTFGAFNFSRSFHRCFEKVESFSKPVIAAVNGFALGGGCELMISCDFRIVAENARIGLPEVNIGAIPAGGGTIKLPRLISPLKAKEILMLGEPISGTEAERIGLINKAVPTAQVFEEAREMARILAQKPPLVLKTIKNLVKITANEQMESALHLEARALSMLSQTSDFMEGTLAFLEKRNPIFNGQ